MGLATSHEHNLIGPCHSHSSLTLGHVSAESHRIFPECRSEQIHCHLLRMATNLLYAPGGISHEAEDPSQGKHSP